MIYLLIGISILAVGILYVAIIRLKNKLKRTEEEYASVKRHLNEINQEKEGKIDHDMIRDMARLSIVATQTDNAIMIMDANGNIEWINEGFSRMYEYSFEEFIRVRGDNILKTSFNPVIKERLERCIKTKQPVYYEAINVTPSGKEIWTHTSLTPILDDNGEVIHLATIDSDISKRKEAGDALVERVNGLSIRINELTKQQLKLFKYMDEFMDRIGESSQRISETDVIVTFIRELSDKIRIMGLNASIESHAVGSLGSGFRVLSGEIVKMSDETKAQAAKIYSIVESIKSTSDLMVQQKKPLEEVSEKYKRVIEELREEVSLIENVALRLN